MIRIDQALVALLACSALSLGCDKKEPPPSTEPPATAAAPVAAAPAAPAVAEVVIDASTLPVEEQFEAEAEGEITAANLQQKLDELEKEIGEP